jgi:4-carboxymuconolactone decarboxylase
VSEPRTPPKVAPLDDADATGDQLAALEPLGPMGSLHIFRTLAVHPKLLRSWLPFGGRLLRGSSLPPRCRELAILRTAALCGCDYEWGQHVGIARDAGLTDDEILACARPTESEDWDEVDALVLTATEELVDGHRMSDATWDGLRDRGWTDAQLVELTMLPGHYAMLAGMLRSVGVEPEGPLPAIGHVSAAP